MIRLVRLPGLSQTCSAEHSVNVCISCLGPWTLPLLMLFQYFSEHNSIGMGQSSMAKLGNTDCSKTVDMPRGVQLESVQPHGEDFTQLRMSCVWHHMVMLGKKRRQSPLWPDSFMQVCSRCGAHLDNLKYSDLWRVVFVYGWPVSQNALTGNRNRIHHRIRVISAPFVSCMRLV